MESWPRGIGAITLFVEDLDTTKQFYREVFGLPVTFEDADSAVFKFGETLINLLKASATLSSSSQRQWPTAKPDRAFSSRSRSTTRMPRARTRQTRS